MLPYGQTWVTPNIRTVNLFVYYQEIKRELKRILLYECRCNERLKVKGEGSKYTGFRGGMEHLKMETRLIDERLESVMGECVI